MRRIASSQQILIPALRSHASCVRNILLREKPLANSSIVTFQPHCSGFVEVKLKRLAHADRKHGNDYSVSCLDVLILCSVFARCKVFGANFLDCGDYGERHQIGCSRPQQNRGHCKTLERPNAQFCALNCRDLLHAKIFSAGPDGGPNDSDFMAVQFVAAGLRRTKRRPWSRR